MNEKQIIEQCLKNDRTAQKVLYQTYAPKMYAVCMRYSGKRLEADDILQEAFIKVFKYLPTFRFQGSFEGWIRKIVVNTALDHIKRYVEPMEEIDDNVSDTFIIDADEVISGLTMQELIALIQELPEGKRLIFNLYVFEGYSHKEIAEMLGISVMTSKGQFSKAKKMLQEKLLNIKTKVL
ncbi:MAG: sigma-70 family RNA polymerase sigma factor [Bacteroidales bacterium]|nr:sigma-70 family RNA polymerase sigma factor [Bacteroidales bacterium]